MTLPSPYPGLRPFLPKEAHLFFGREAQVEDMLARLEDHRFLAVVGTSGCGKSSLVRAGLIPALEQGFLSDAKPKWRIAVMSPGSAPFDNLTTALLTEAALGHERRSASQQAAALLQATLRRGPLGLVEAVAESHLPEDTNLLLVVDQFEEIFRYRKQMQNVNDADAFVNLLLASAQSQQSEVPMYVVIAMRSDFLGACALFTGLPEAINDSQFLNPRLTRDQYHSAIVEPALVEGGKLDDMLINRLLNDLRGEPGQLPVLQHALMRMWTLAGDHALKRALTLKDYNAVGGLAKALSEHCDEILNELNPEQQRIAQVMFRALCERSSEQRDTRHPVKLREVAAIAGIEVEAVIPVVDAFRGAGRNFLTPSLPIPLDGETTLDISHESLIWQWPTLTEWVEDETESARQYQRLEEAAKRRQQGEGAELWYGVDLENARVWKEREKPTAAWAARYGDAYKLAMGFLKESETEEEKKRREKERVDQRELRRLKVVAAAIGILLLVTIGVAIYAFKQKNMAAEARRHAEQKKTEAVKAAEEAQRQQHEAEKAKQDAQENAQKAERERRAAFVHLARYLSAMSSIEAQPALSILLGLEAIYAWRNASSKPASIPAAEEALRHAIAKADTALVGHTDAVWGVAFSPDGQMLATTSADKTVRLWSLSDPTAKPHVLRGHEGQVNGVAFSPDGQRLATTSADKTVRLWSRSDPTAKPHVLRGHEGQVNGVAFSPDGQRLATTSADKTVRLWSRSNPTAKPRVLPGHTDAVWGVAFSPDGQGLATTSADKTVRLWSRSDPTAKPRVLRGHTDAVWGVAFSPDGQGLATTSADQTVRLWSRSDPTAKPHVLPGHEGQVNGVAFSPDGQGLATTSADKTVRLRSLSDPTAKPHVLPGHTDAVWGVAFSPDGQMLATTSADQTVRLRSLSNPTAEPRVLQSHEGVVNGVAFSRDGQMLATTSADKTVRLWSRSDPTAKPHVLPGHTDAVWGVAFSPDGQMLATTSADQTVRLWSLSDPTAKPRVLRGHEGVVIGVAFSPDGQMLATTSADKTVRLWSRSDPTAKPHVLRGHTDAVWGVAFSPDGQMLATTSADKTVRLWSPSDPTAEPRVLQSHEGVVIGVAFSSPDGQMLATTSAHQTVRLWSPSDPTAKPHVLRGHEGVVIGVAFSPDGQMLATTSVDQTVRLWSPSDPTAKPRVLRGHEGVVIGVAFSPDGQMLATTSVDQTVRLWSMGIDDLVRIGCRSTSGNFSYTEWQQYLDDKLYRKTCQNHPLHPSFLEIIRGQVKNGDVEGAVAKLRIALQVDGISDVVLQQEARRLTAPGWVDKGLELAKQGAIREAVAAIEAAQASDSNLEIAAASWNSLCWFGSLGGFATDVIAACERAVALEPDHGGIRDSRGVARALTGDYPGAINDFQRYLEWGPKNGESEESIRQRQDWIRMLQANQNPFNEELIKLLRDQ